MDDAGCSTADTMPYNLMQLGFALIGIIVWSLLLIVHFSASAVFHRNFSLLFSCTIACFMSIFIAELPGLIRVLTMNDFEDYFFKDFFFAFPDVFYTAQLFLIPTLLIERVIATKKHSTYELKGNSFFPFLIVLFLLQLIGVSLYIYFWRQYYFYDMYISLAIAAINLLGASILRLKNRRMISHSKHNGESDLSTKYQMNENVRALQIIIFYCTFEAFFTIVDSLAMIIHKVDFMFSVRDCRAKQHEQFVYWRTAGFILQIALPFFLILFHENYELAFLRMFCRCWCAGGRKMNSKVKFRTDESEVYFRDLDKQWARI
ncbi:hypothetical protein PENTCL1PPCAC_9891, partial [Pristionchus entomophagus]